MNIAAITVGFDPARSPETVNFQPLGLPEQFPGLPGQIPLDRIPSDVAGAPFIPEPADYALLGALLLVVVCAVHKLRKNNLI